MGKWEYKIIEFATDIFKWGQVREKAKSDADLVDSVSFRALKDEEGLLGMKKVSNPLPIQEIEKIFNELGENGWELCESFPLVTNVAHAFRYGTRTTSVQFIFRRKK